MYHYLFTNDLRISRLNEALSEAGECYINNSVPSAEENKSANNYMNTVGFYFNLTNTSKCAVYAAKGDIRKVVLNFIKKFQFPNPRSKESLSATVADCITLAPMRTIVQLLYAMRMIDPEKAFLTKREILEKIFLNDKIAKSKSPDILSLAVSIVEGASHDRNADDEIIPEDAYEATDGFEWKHCQRQLREMIKILTWSGCVSESDKIIEISHDNLSKENEADLFEIITYTDFWLPDSQVDFNKNKESYQNYMDISEHADTNQTPHLIKKFTYKSLPYAFQNPFARRYITSLLAKPFVILTGNSGTGKTQTSKQFAEYLEACDAAGKRNWLIVPVGADWTDNTKILGYYNPIANGGEGEYIKSDVLRFMERANRNKAVPYFLILDEMNLSHVERYFSDFLSHMETPDYPFEIDNYGIVEYPRNMFVIGTVNIDETTYMFSPKVLDRANVVEFKPERDKIMSMFVSESTVIKAAPVNDGTSQGFLELSRSIQSGKSDLENAQLQRISSVFEKIYDTLEKYGFEYAFRTVREIRQYVSAAQRLQENFTDTEMIRAIDEQFLQKILPKIHGNKKEIGTLLDELLEICESESLINSKAKINQMKGKLNATQYASFI